MYPVYVSPDGEHEQQVSSRVREVELRHQGWKPKPAARPAPGRPAPTQETTPKQEAK